MAKQDDYIRVTLRLPPELHDRLTKAAEAGSLNAEIISRLDESFQEVGIAANDPARITHIGAQIAEAVIRRLEKRGEIAKRFQARRKKDDQA